MGRIQKSSSASEVVACLVADKSADRTPNQKIQRALEVTGQNFGGEDAVCP